MGFVKSRLVSVVDLFAVADLEPAGFQVQPRLVSAVVLRARLDRAVGAAVLRAHLRLRRAHAVDGSDRAAQASRRGPGQARAGVRTRSSTALLVAVLAYFVATRDVGRVPLRRAVLDVQPVRHDADVDRARRAAAGHGVRPQSVLPVSVSGRRLARCDLASSRSSRSSAGPSATPARSARRRASGAPSGVRRSSRPSVSAATTASASTSTSRSARTGSSCGGRATSCLCRREPLDAAGQSPCNRF